MSFLRRLYDQPYLLLSLTSLFWAGNTVLGRFAADIVPPVTLAWLRWAIASCILIGFAWPHLKRDWPVLRRNAWIVVILSLAGISAYNTLAYLGLKYTEAINGLLMQSTGPLLIGLWTFVLYRERLTLGQVCGIFVSLAGVLLIIARGDLGNLATLRPNPGDLLFLLGMFLYGLYSALLRKRPPVHWLSLLTVTFALGGFFLTPLLVWEQASGHHIAWSAEAVATIVYVAVFPSILAYICFNRGVELIGPNRAGPFFHLVPLFGSVLAFVFLGEALWPYHALAYGMIILGVIVAARGKAAEAPENGRQVVK